MEQLSQTAQKQSMLHKNSPEGHLKNLSQDHLLSFVIVPAEHLAEECVIEAWVLFLTLWPFTVISQKKTGAAISGKLVFLHTPDHTHTHTVAVLCLHSDDKMVVKWKYLNGCWTLHQYNTDSYSISWILSCNCEELLKKK